MAVWCSGLRRRVGYLVGTDVLADYCAFAFRAEIKMAAKYSTETSLGT